MPALRNKKFDNEYGAYLSGEEIKSIAKRIGASATVVSKAFVRRRWPIRSRWKTNEENREIIKAMYATGDYRMWELAICFGYKSYVSISTIVGAVKPKKKRKTNRRTRKALPAFKICGYRDCDREVVYKYCRPLHMRLERSAKAKDKREAENAAIIYRD